MSDWIQQNDFQLKKNRVRIETSKYTQAIKCSKPDCQVVLVWNAMGGEDEDLEFRVKNCTCGEIEYYTLCCSEHKNNYVCPTCEK